MNVATRGAIGLSGCLLLSSCSDDTALLGHYHRAGSAGRNEGTAGVAADASDMGSGGAGATGNVVRADAGSVDAGKGRGGAAGSPTGDGFAVENGTRAQFCAGVGPAIRVVSNASAGTATPICTPVVGRRLFRYGLCSCGDLSIAPPSTVFSLDSFDSNAGPYTTGESGASLGVDGALIGGANLVSISGTGIFAGRGTLGISTTRVFGGDLKTNASVDLSQGGIFSVGRDFWSDADIRGGLTSSVGRDVYVTPGRTGADTLTTVGGTVQTRSFAIAPPCACGGDAELDVAALVARSRFDNDDAALGLSAAELTSALAKGAIPTGFDCGRFALGSVSIPGAAMQKVAGRLALFIDGDLTLNGNFASDLAARAEVDVIVRGDLVVTAPAQIGVPARPSALRLYVGGSRPLESTELVTYAAQIYAPHAPFRVKGTTLATSTSLVHTYGSIFVASFEISSEGVVHYDRAIVSLGDACTGGPPPRCDDCRQCPAGLACIDGACAACRSDADCCEPFGCTNGRCQPLIYQK